MEKAWWRSKTLWVNIVAGAVLLVQTQTGFAVDPEIQAGFLALVNLVLRLVTKEPVGLTNEAGPPPFPGVDAGGPGLAGS